VQPKLPAAASPAPFKKLETAQTELSSGQQTMETAAQAEEFEQALNAANDLGTKADAYKAEVDKLTQLKQQYDQALAPVQDKLKAAQSPPPFKKLETMQSELSTGQQTMQTVAQEEDFERAAQLVGELGTKADAYTAEVTRLEQFKQQYEQVRTTVQPKLDAAASPSPFAKLAPAQAELASGGKQMESAAQAEDFEQALQVANDLATKADAYTAATQEQERSKQDYEQSLAQLQPRLDEALQQPGGQPTREQQDIAAVQARMQSEAGAGEYVQAKSLLAEVKGKVDAHLAASPRVGPPTVTGVSPDKCAREGGTKVTITGSGFTGATKVEFGWDTQQISAPFNVDSDTQITATTPDTLAQFFRGDGIAVTVATPLGKSPAPAQPHLTFVGDDAPKVRTPPEGVLRRRIDGQIFWEPNPATWGSGSPPAPRAWVDGFLRFYGLGPDPAGKAECVFDSAPSSISAVVALANAQASLAGYASASAVQVAIETYNLNAGQQAGADVGKKTDAGDTEGVEQSVKDLERLNMPAMLAALEKIRAEGKLERLALMKPAVRLAAAIRSVARQLDDEWKSLMKQLNDADALAIREHVYGRVVSGDPAAPVDGEDTGSQSLAQRISETVRAKRDPARHFEELAGMSMDAVFGVLVNLKKNGTLEDFRQAKIPDRIWAAILTVQGEFGGQWERVVARVRDPADVKAILARAPANVTPRAAPEPEDEKPEHEDKTHVSVGVMFVRSSKAPVRRKGESHGETIIELEGEYAVTIWRRGRFTFEGSGKIKGGMVLVEKGGQVTVKGYELTGGPEGSLKIELLKGCIEAAVFGGLAVGLEGEKKEGNWGPVEFTRGVSGGGKIAFFHPRILGGHVKLVFQSEYSLSKKPHEPVQGGPAFGVGFEVEF
jgi:hypothetical protein